MSVTYLWEWLPGLAGRAPKAKKEVLQDTLKAVLFAWSPLNKGLQRPKSQLESD